MARKSNDNRTAVLAVLSDHRWHSGLELIEVGGTRAGARVHELRRGKDGGPQRRILCKVIASESRYRWTCDCGPGEPGQPEVQDCPVCRAAWAEYPGPALNGAPPLATEQALAADKSTAASTPAVQLGLFKGAA